MLDFSLVLTSCQDKGLGFGTSFDLRSIASDTVELRIFYFQVLNTNKAVGGGGQIGPPLDCFWI